MQSKKITGFSLLEMLFALSISIIVLGFSFYGLKNFLLSAKSKAECQQLLNAINYAKNAALAKQTKITVCGSLDGCACSAAWEQHIIVLEKENVLFQFDSNHDGKIHSRFFPLGKHVLEFLPNGWLNSENGTFWFCASGVDNPDWAIVLNKSGRARVVNPDSKSEIKDDMGKKLLCT